MQNLYESTEYQAKLCAKCKTDTTKSYLIENE